MPHVLERALTATTHDRAKFRIRPVLDPPNPLPVAAATTPLALALPPLLGLVAGSYLVLYATAVAALLAIAALFVHVARRPTALELEVATHAVIARTRTGLGTREVTVPLATLRDVTVRPAELVFHTDDGDRVVPFPERSSATRGAVEHFLGRHVAAARPRLGDHDDVPRDLARLVRHP